LYITLPDLLDQRAKTRPKQEAHVFKLISGTDPQNSSIERKTITFEELAVRSLDTAARLLKLGLKPGDRIAIFGRVVLNGSAWSMGVCVLMY
jgi:acyl-CoA synthetase (AMP-forming)/AMP-acid ligase II